MSMPKSHVVSPFYTCWPPGNSLSCRKGSIQEFFSTVDVKLASQWLPELPLFPRSCTGMAIHVSQSAGSCPSPSEALNTWLKCFTRTCDGGFTIAGWIPSGPAAFDVYIFQALPHFFLRHGPVQRLHIEGDGI